MPVLLTRLEEHPIAWPDHLDRTSPPRCETDALGDVDRLAVRVRVPRGPCAGREMDIAGADPERTGRGGNGVEVHDPGEPLARPCRRLDAVCGDLHDSSPDVDWEPIQAKLRLADVCRLGGCRCGARRRDGRPLPGWLA